ncbi:MAG TPA: hypothetical protein VNK47_03060 [Candidatus Dormibacteraeota bacterium]|nr:hypothetical protein [Candidatus Dormibacteraeota bacterium]
MNGNARPRVRILRIAALAALLASLPSVPADAQQSPPVDPSLYSAMRWRLIGPHRAGRVTSVAGIPGDPAIFYMGTPGGGVWKTTDGGQVWKPIFDSQRVASIGAVAVSPSNPSIVYVGTGEQTPGNGIYKSTDAGTTWTNIGLADTRYISSIFVDPKNSDVVVVGVIGHPILTVAAPSTTRGVYKTTDGGKTWKHTLYKDDFAGVSDLCADPENPRNLYAAVWHPADWRAGEDNPKSRDAWLFKSTDEGTTWSPLPDKGLPEGGWGRVGIAVAPGDRGRRLFAILTAGLFRSDDGGLTWRQITKDPRILGSLYFSRVFVDPRNAEVVYVMQTSAYRSADGGKTFIAFKGAPGGDDYHTMWIDPQNSSHIVFGVDQGAVVSYNGGQSWTSWFNQPTGQFYHVITDNQFPYIAYAAQQDSGTAAVPSRSDYGEITFRDWWSIAGFEYSYIAPDPLHPNTVYSGGWYGSVVRYDKNTGQFVHVFTRGKKYRTSQMPPVVFSPLDPHTLYFATQFVLKTVDEGRTWQEISPDLTARAEPPTKSELRRPHESQLQARLQNIRNRPDSHGPAANVESYSADTEYGDDEDEDPAAKRPPAITALVPSPVQSGLLWAGTTNGLVFRTEDAANWTNVSPAEFTADTQVISMEASRFDAATVYLVAEIRKDSTPYVYRTRDAGKSWQKITHGLEANWVARAVREDSVRKSLLYAATENAVYVSFNDGDDWQSLQLNLPASDMRDLAVHGNDLVVATYGRALWILDDVSPLRLAPLTSAGPVLLHPANAIRVRWDNDAETPRPPEVPAGQNPPDGAILYYYLPAASTGELTLEIRDENKNLVRLFTSAAPSPDTSLKNAPDYWFAPPASLSKSAGLNRFVWDLRYDAPPILAYSYYGEPIQYVEYTLTINSVPGQTPLKQMLGPLAVPGKYELTLIDGASRSTQSLIVQPDPRIHISPTDYLAQFAASRIIGAGLKSSYAASEAAAPFVAAIADRVKSLEQTSGQKEADRDREEKKEKAEKHEFASPLEKFQESVGAIFSGTTDSPGIGAVNRDLARLSFMVQSGDAAPSAPLLASLEESCSGLSAAIEKWPTLAQSLPEVNAFLAQQKLAPLPALPVLPISTGAACTP